jgi:hypothetical protein
MILNNFSPNILAKNNGAFTKITASLCKNDRYNGFHEKRQFLA